MAEKNGSKGPTAGSPKLAEDQFRAAKEFNFWRGIYNKDKNYILGRTPKNWGQLFIFYALFYLVLAILFAICMKGLYWSLDDDVPKWQLDESRIGVNPGLGYRPSSILKEGSLIWYNPTNLTQVDFFAKKIDDFLAPYRTGNKTVDPKQEDCGFDKNVTEGKYCKFSIKNITSCSDADGYGYATSNPCVFLKLNRIFGWDPLPFAVVNATEKTAQEHRLPEDRTKTLQLPENMPLEMKKYIVSRSPSERNQVFVTCDGEHPADREVVGPVVVSPPGFPNYYYPYKNVKGYLSPLVSVRFERPVQRRVINVECIAWAGNIHYKGGERDRSGSVHFEILIDPEAVDPTKRS